MTSQRINLTVPKTETFTQLKSIWASRRGAQRSQRVSVDQAVVRTARVIPTGEVSRGFDALFSPRAGPAESRGLLASASEGRGLHRKKIKPCKGGILTWRCRAHFFESVTARCTSTLTG